jgi:hypothetical protein
MSDQVMWWGYLHSNGVPQLKRWFGDHKDYTEDCEGNEFVLQVVKPFPADNHKEAMNFLIEDLGLCCEHPSRNMNGGCDNCKDPCL